MFLKEQSRPIADNGCNKWFKSFSKYRSYVEGIITSNYAPKDTDNVLEGERCLYT